MCKYLQNQSFEEKYSAFCFQATFNMNRGGRREKAFDRIKGLQRYLEIP